MKVEIGNKYLTKSFLNRGNYKAEITDFISGFAVGKIYSIYSHEWMTHYWYSSGPKKGKSFTGGPEYDLDIENGER